MTFKSEKETLKKARELLKERQKQQDKTNGRDRQQVDFDRMRNKQQQLLTSLSNNLNVRLDFRCQHGCYGYSFHDRFLILVPSDKEVLPVAYSLGSSVNGIGKQHHIIQKITNPRIILASFELLWSALKPANCRILSLPDTAIHTSQ